MRGVPHDLAQIRSTKPSGFSTTRWSLIVTGAKLDVDQQKAHAALAELCRIYWKPVFSFIWRRGSSREDAQDLTQDFFAMVLQTNWLRHADATRGRFRSLLLKSVQNFLIDAFDRKDARKRGGGIRFLSWHDWSTDAAVDHSLADAAQSALPAERLFDFRWASTVVEQALTRLGEECERNGRLRLFTALRPHLIAERSELSYVELAERLGVPSHVVKRQLHNLRQRYRRLLRDEVGRTVRDPDDVDEEIRYLCATLASGTADPP